MTCFFFWSQVLAQLREVRERVFVHPNSQVFVAGETLRFSAYTLSHTSGKVSSLSKILYVQLVGEDGPIFEQKVQLEKGRGSGEFFVNSLVPTGRYQLLAYTRWMRNFEDYFQLPITVINPFEKETPSIIADSLTRINFHHPNGYLISEIENRVGFRISTPKGKPGIREGKLIDAAGSVVQSFVPNGSGLGTFNFEPKANELYRVLLEGLNGTISFHEFMPIESNGYLVQVEKRPNDLVLIPRVAGFPDGDLTLQIHFADHTWNSISVKSDEVLTYRYDELPSDVFKVRLLQANVQVFSRAILPSKFRETNVYLTGLESTYAPRDSIKVSLELPVGEYSVSIHQQGTELYERQISSDKSRVWNEFQDPFKDRLQPPLINDDLGFHEFIQPFSVHRSFGDSVSWLPEIRNELLEITLKTNAGEPISGEEVVLSFPGEAFQLKAGFTDQHGQVVFHYRPMNGNRVGFFSVLSQYGSWQMELERKFMTSFPAFDYRLNHIDSLAALEIKRRSINSQLMNTFSEPPMKVSDTSEIMGLQFTQWNFEYTLDDYQRFPDFKEYFVEYIIGAGIKAGGINIRKEFYRPEFQNAQLVLLDGVPVSAKRILELDPYLVEKVKVMMNRVYLGPSVFDGVVLIETYTHDLAGYNPISSEQFDYQGISNGSVGFTGPNAQHWHSPDRRVNLYWEPSLTWKGGWFYLNSATSDVSGVFEIRIEGVTSEGKPVSIQESFTVTSTEK